MRVHWISRFVTAFALAASACLLAAAPAGADVLGHWPLDQTSGTSVPDATGSGHTGTVTGTGSWEPGHIGNALRFTGDINDRVLLSPVVDIGAKWTMAGWFKNLQPQAAYRTMFRGKGGHHPVLVQSGNTRLGTFDNGGTGFRYSEYDMSAMGSGWSGWHHIAAVGSLGTTDFYVDGDYVGTSDFQSTTDVGSFGNNYTGTQLFAEYVDDVAVWDETLSPGQIKALIEGASPSSLHDRKRQELMGWWKLDESGGTAASDSSGNGHTGSVLGTATWTTGHVDGALHFTGGTENKIELERPVNLPADWTITAWFKELYNVGSWRTLTRGVGGDHQLLIHGTNHQLGTYDNVGGTGWHSSGGFNMSTLSDTEWHHISAVGSNEETRFYVDGQYVGTSNYQSTSDVGIIGNYTTTDQRFAKYLDDVAVWNRALRPNQVLSLTRQQNTPATLPMSPLVGWWKLDEQSGTTVADASGYGFHGSLRPGGSYNWESGHVDGGLHLQNGHADAIVLDQRVDLGDDWTLTAWFKDLLPPNTWRTLARGSNDHQLLISTAQELGTYDNAGGSKWHSSGFDMSPYDDGDWHHIAAVGTGGATHFYLDGVWKATSDFQSTDDIWYLGNHTGASQKFANYLDDLAIFDVALGAGQILSLAERTRTPATVVPEPTTLVLLGIGGLVALGRRRRRRHD